VFAQAAQAKRPVQRRVGQLKSADLHARMISR
jgi:hypothetical protein